MSVRLGHYEVCQQLFAIVDGMPFLSADLFQLILEAVDGVAEILRDVVPFLLGLTGLVDKLLGDPPRNRETDIVSVVGVGRLVQTF